MSGSREKIYHVVLPERWAELDEAEDYVHESLAAEGFIHCSFRDQVDAVIERYYRDVRSLIVLEIDPEKLTSELLIEPSTGGEKYPHIYGAINRSAVIGIENRDRA
ncbi:MAG: DUF952 domain-containing protein [Pyrinomonadaceae bacterium]